MTTNASKKMTALTLETDKYGPITIDDHPYSAHRRPVGGKYTEFFNQLKIGQRLRCRPEAAKNIINALEAHLKARGHAAPHCSYKTRCEDGHGGVWWLGEKPRPPLRHGLRVSNNAAADNAFDAATSAAKNKSKRKP